jgi:hypothetical protein
VAGAADPAALGIAIRNLLGNQVAAIGTILHRSGSGPRNGLLRGA